MVPMIIMASDANAIMFGNAGSHNMFMMLFPEILYQWTSLVIIPSYYYINDPSFRKAVINEIKHSFFDGSFMVFE